jgi:hypothetical protein
VKKAIKVGWESAESHRHGHVTIGGMDPATRVCPFCGEPPGAAIFCAACGRNLAAVEQLPTRAEWEATRPAEDGTLEQRSADDAAGGTLEQRSAGATAAFLAAMHAAGDPGVTRTPKARQKAFGRTGHVDGWVVRPVDRDEEDLRKGRYVPGFVLTVDGDYHRLDNEVRGWGQRDFPRYFHTVSPEPVEPPADDRVVDELAAVLREHGVAAD